MAICDLASADMYTLSLLLDSHLPNSVCWKQVTKDGPHARGEKLNSTFWRRNVKDFVKHFVKTIPYSTCSPSIFPSRARKVKSHSSWILLLESKSHERRDLVLFTAVSPATETAGPRVGFYKYMMTCLFNKPISSAELR